MNRPSLPARVVGKVLAAVRDRLSVGIGASVVEATADELQELLLRARGQFDRLGSTPTRRDTTVTRVADGDVGGEWVATSATHTPERVVMHVHGGAYVMGGPHTHRGIARDLSRASGGRVFLPRYRLAPEHPYPAAIDDVEAAWRWLVDDLGVDPSMVALSGDSAGGGMALSLLLRLRDQGGPLPACYVGLSPWTDLTMSGESVRANNGRDLMFGTVSLDLVDRLPALYASDVSDPFVSPLFADLRGLPPMLVHAGSHELILDDSIRLVERARAAGVDASLGLFEGMWHVFQAFPLPETRRSMTEIGGFVRRHTSGRRRAALAGATGGQRPR